MATMGQVVAEIFEIGGLAAGCPAFSGKPYRDLFEVFERVFVGTDTTWLVIGNAVPGRDKRRNKERIVLDKANKTRQYALGCRGGAIICSLKNRQANEAAIRAEFAPQSQDKRSLDRPITGLSNCCLTFVFNKAAIAGWGRKSGDRRAMPDTSACFGM